MIDRPTPLLSNVVVLPSVGGVALAPAPIHDDEITGYAADDHFGLEMTERRTRDLDVAEGAVTDDRFTESIYCRPSPLVAVSICGTSALIEADEECEDPGDFTYAPTDIQVWEGDGWSEPRLDSLVTCNDPTTVAVTAADFRSLPLVPSAIVVGPPGGWLPVNMVNVVYTDATAQVLDTVLLGQPVRVRATPVRFRWDWDDGSSPLTTSDPGAAHPNHTVFHTYAKTGVYTVSMETQWSGEYSLDAGATYAPIVGLAATTSTAPAVTVTELRSRLVEDTLG